MQAIILAAGSGKRLGKSTPKPLLKIGGKYILTRLIEQLRALGIGEIVVVVGYKGWMLEKAVNALGVKSVSNPFYHISDNLVSFWIGQRYLSDQCLMSHADLLVEDRLLRRLFAAKGDVVLPLDSSAADRESMKIKVTGGRVTELSKTVNLQEAAGESIPLMKFSRDALLALKKITDDFVAREQLKRYLEDAVGQLISSGKFSSTILDVTGYRWVEIDTRADWEWAKELFSG